MTHEKLKQVNDNQIPKAKINKGKLVAKKSDMNSIDLASDIKPIVLNNNEFPSEIDINTDLENDFIEFIEQNLIIKQNVEISLSTDLDDPNDSGEYSLFASDEISKSIVSYSYQDVITGKKLKPENIYKHYWKLFKEKK